MIFLYILIGVLVLLLWPFIFVGFWSIFYNPKKDYEKPSNSSYNIMIFAYKIGCLLGNVRIHFSGQELLPKNQHYLLVSNHRSKFDHMIQSISLKKSENEKIAFVSKAENFKMFVGRRYIKRNCYISLERDSGRSAVKMIIEAIRLINKENCSVGIYPEGSRSKTLQMLPFHAGSFKIAQKAKCPIVVGITQGTEKIHKNWPKKTDVYFKIVKVYKAEEIVDKNTNELSEEIENLMKVELENQN